MLVREIMTSPAYSVREDSTLEAALKLMVTARVTGLPVVDGGGRVVGIISEADLLKSDLTPDPRAHMLVARQTSGPVMETVGQLMTAHPHTVREDSDVADVAHTFARTSWKSVPVVRAEVLIGVVSRSDVIRAMSRSDAEIAAEITRALQETGLRVWRVEVTDGTAHLTGPDSEQGSSSSRERSAATSIAQSVKGVRHVTSQGADG